MVRISCLFIFFAISMVSCVTYEKPEYQILKVFDDEPELCYQVMDQVEGRYIVIQHKYCADDKIPSL